MDRLPSWVLVVAALAFAALAVWSVTDENWAGAIAGAILAAASIAALRRGPRAG